MSASCSIEPDSRRSESCGRLSSRCSTARLSCKSASTGTLRSLASVLSPRLISEIRSEEHTSELQSLMRISYAVFCLKKKKQSTNKAIDIHKFTTNTSNHHANNNKTI